MTVGETLTEARRRASLSVDELSERTRIRETVIRSIEQDDFEACGGDLYVRGYVRAIAGAVGIDAQPLIREFDLVYAGQPGSFRLPPFTADADADATRFDLPLVRDDPTATTFDLPPQAPADPLPAAVPPVSDRTRFDLPPVTADPVSRKPAADGPVTEDLMAAGYDLGPASQPDDAGSVAGILPAPDPAGPRPPASGRARPRAGAPRSRRRTFSAAAVIAVVLAAAAVLGVRLASAGPDAGTAASASASARASASAARASASAQASVSASQSAAARASAAAQASASARASGSASAKAAAKKAAAARIVALPVASVTAYGENGSGGDDPGGAAGVAARHPAAPWTTQWYVSPQFGMLKHGTGLLLDLGRKVTVTSIRAGLSAYKGADVQISVGNGTASQNLRLAASASDAGGVLRLTLRHPAAARYVLIWFTQLPPDGAGHYSETVSYVAVSGRR